MRQISAAESASYAGSGVSIASSLTLTDVGIIIGIVTALLTFGINAYFLRRKDRREAEEHEARMRVLREEADHG